MGSSKAAVVQVLNFEANFNPFVTSVILPVVSQLNPVTAVASEVTSVSSAIFIFNIWVAAHLEHLTARASFATSNVHSAQLVTAVASVSALYLPAYAQVLIALSKAW